MQHVVSILRLMPNAAKTSALRTMLCWSTIASVQACIVEDRNFDEEFARQRAEDSSDDDTTGPDEDSMCTKYCNEMKLVCTDENKMFADDKSCLSACATLPESPPKGQSAGGTNTIACRYNELQDAKSEPSYHCSRAAIASQACGNPCETYCTMQPKVCGEQATEVVLEQEECERRCAGVPKTETFSITDNYDDDSIQCRLIHLVTASASDSLAAVHCPHAKINSPLVCGEERDVDCKNYCHTVAVACTGELTQYPSTEVCEKTCLALPAGTMRDRTSETVGCRIYHAYVALGDPVGHCSHAGPTTDGHCGSPQTSNCFNYCTLAEKACESEFSTKFANQAECIDECLPLPGSAPDSEYPPVDGDGGETQAVQRFMLAATRVLAEEPGASCEDVFEPGSLLGL